MSNLKEYKMLSAQILGRGRETGVSREETIQNRGF